MRETTGVLFRKADTNITGMHMRTLAQNADRDRPMSQTMICRK